MTGTGSGTRGTGAVTGNVNGCGVIGHMRFVFDFGFVFERSWAVE